MIRALAALLISLSLPLMSCGPSADECLKVYYETWNIPAYRLTAEQSIAIKQCADHGKYHGYKP